MDRCTIVIIFISFIALGARNCQPWWIIFNVFMEWTFDFNDAIKNWSVEIDVRKNWKEENE